ncbi:MAG: TrbI/VirB10 family protein [Hydrogenophaga sp.]|nr:TrbI/VirB10 family protein [Hydrogenophaga sp.]
MSKLVWPLSMGVAGLLIYGAFASESDSKTARLVEPEPELIKPAPRAVRPPPEPDFVPMKVAAAVPPLPQGTALPTVDQAAVDAAARREAAAEALRLRRRAPLMVPVAGAGNAVAEASDVSAGVVQDVAMQNIPAMNAATAERAAQADRNVSTPQRDAGFVLTALEPDDQTLDQKILQGKSIPAVLETAIHTALPGQVRAMVSEDVYGESGRRVLIPKMSRLVGEYETAKISAGQSRVMVIWQRALLPDGKSVRLASPGTDGLGRSGITGDVDNHYLERFGAAFLVSMLGVALEEAASTANMSSNNAGGLIIVDRARSEAVRGLQSTVESILKSQANIPPTIQIAQGSRVRVFVARDLDLSSVAPQAR